MMHSRWFHGACVSTVILASACTANDEVKDNDETELGVDYESLDQDLIEADAFDDMTADDELDDEAPTDIAGNNDALSSAEDPELEPSQEFHPGGGGGDHPTIHAAFALYDNSTVDPATQERTVSKHYPSFHKRGSWPVTNLLNGSYRVWSYRRGGGHWWNGPVHDQRKWIYDDTNRSNHPGEAGQLRRTIDERSDNGPGIVYMAFSEDFQSFLGLKSLKREVKALNRLDVQYGYEVFSGKDGTNPYIHWFRHFSRSGNKFPIFDITAWSSSPNCHEQSAHPSRKLTRKQIRASTKFRGKHRVAFDLFVGFFSACFIEDADMQKLINWLDTTQDIINNER